VAGTPHFDRGRRIRLVLWTILAANWAVAAVKLALGLSSGSAALTADGLHSTVDGASNVVGLVAMWFAGRPPDADHPYGHEKFEALASLAIGGMIAVGMFEMGRTAVEALLSDLRPEVSSSTIAITLLTMGVNLTVTTLETREGRRLNSTLLLADAQHTMSDVLVSGAVVVSLLLSKLSVPHADSVAALLVLGFVGRAAWQVILRAVEPLSDAARLDPEQVRRLCLAVPGVREVRAVRSRGMDDAVRVDLKIDVDALQTVAAGHQIANAVEGAIHASFPTVREVVVHVEPAAGQP
jgi:cation diffusion facilitator family transporter